MSNVNALDRFIGFFSPHAGLRRAAARRALASLSGYEAAERSHQRKWLGGGNIAPNQLVQQGADSVASISRNLERNHDLTRGILRTLVNNAIGAQGIGVDPQPMKKDGSGLHAEYAAALAREWRDFCRTPEVTHRFGMAKCQRMLANSRFRDGESFAQMLMGNVPLLDHGTRVPLSIEMFERDMVPMTYNDEAAGITQGIKRNAWGRPKSIYVYKSDPREYNRILVNASQLKEIQYDNVLHYASLDRIGQLRGVGDLASILNRTEDLKDYEESERIAAKVAASLTAYVKRNGGTDFDPSLYERDAEGNLIRRESRMQPGMILDTLQVGEEIGLIDSKRPNQGLVTWRSGQLRAIAAGAGPSHSSISREYDGSYSAQRQELVESWVSYAVLTEEAVDQIVRPIYEAFVDMADRSGVARIPRDVDPLTVNDCLYLGQQMPWIDPAKEAIAWEKLVQAGFASEVEVIRRRGLNPRDVLAQLEMFRKESEGKGLKFSSNIANASTGGAGTVADNNSSTDPEPTTKPKPKDEGQP